MDENIEILRKKPTFLPSITNSENTWFLNFKLKNEGLLISYDVLKSGSLLNKNKPIHKILKFKGFILLDNGAYGKNTESDALSLFLKQKQLEPNAAIILDKIPYQDYSSVKQWKMIRDTVNNAKKIRKHQKIDLILMCVIQGNNFKQLEYCSKAHKKNKFKYFGIPLSYLSKNRKYSEAINKFLLIKKIIGNGSYFHGLGCGSRTLIMLLSHLGMNTFDSSSFYKIANYNKQIKQITFCSIGKPLNIKECKLCLFNQPAPKSIDHKIQYNLLEIQKEVFRCRCAIKKNVMVDYIKKRLSKYSFNKLKKMI